jgi:hypothetical protein
MDYSKKLGEDSEEQCQNAQYNNKRAISSKSSLIIRKWKNNDTTRATKNSKISSITFLGKIILYPNSKITKYDVTMAPHAIHKTNFSVLHKFTKWQCKQWWSVARKLQTNKPWINSSKTDRLPEVKKPNFQHIIAVAWIKNDKNNKKVIAFPYLSNGQCMLLEIITCSNIKLYERSGNYLVFKAHMSTDTIAERTRIVHSCSFIVIVYWKLVYRCRLPREAFTHGIHM